MNVFTNVSSQVTGLGSSLGSWFKKEGTEVTPGQGQDGASEQPADPTQAPPSSSPPSANVSEQSVKGSADENEDAASNHSG